MNWDIETLFFCFETINILKETFKKFYQFLLFNFFFCDYMFCNHFVKKILSECFFFRLKSILTSLWIVNRLKRLIVLLQCCILLYSDRLMFHEWIMMLEGSRWSKYQQMVIKNRLKYSINSKNAKKSMFCASQK